MKIFSPSNLPSSSFFRKSLVVLVTTLGLGMVSAAQAALLEVTPTDKKIENHTLASSAVANIESGKISLTEVGAGIRTKKVVFVHVQVYLGELFVSEASTFNKTDLLASAAAQNAVAMRLTFLRSVDSNKILTSFEESFKANGVDGKDPQVAQLIDAVRAGGDIEKGKILSVIGYKNDKAEIVALEDAHGKVTAVKGSEGFIRKIFSLWLGKPGDSGVEAFQKALRN